MMAEVSLVFSFQGEDQGEVKEEDGPEISFHVIAERSQCEDADLDPVSQPETGDSDVEQRKKENKKLTVKRHVYERKDESAEFKEEVFTEGFQIPAVLKIDLPVIERDQTLPARLIETAVHPVCTEGVDQIKDHKVRPGDLFEEFDLPERDLFDEVDDVHLCGLLVPF
jgi:hypothetical protein